MADVLNPNNAKSASQATTYLTAAALLIGAFVTLTTWYGVYHFYSPIPWWDEWDGYLTFYRSVAIDGAGLHVWFSQHVDHRIFTSRVLFWLDLRYFHGNHIILFVAQQAMLVAIVAALALAARRTQKNPWWVLGISAAFVFSWVQYETFKWGFETQVVAAFFFTVMSINEYVRPESGPIRRIVVAFLLAALAEFSMGNGIAAPCCIVAIAIITRRPLKEIVLVGIVAAALVSLYLIGYVSPGTYQIPLPGSLTLHRLAFLLAFMANPLAQVGSSNKVCIVIGALVLLAGTGVSLRDYFARNVTPYRALLIGIFLFVAVSGLAAAFGRGLGGAGAALASRYTMGPLLGWTVLLMLLAESYAVPAMSIAAVGAVVLSVAQLQTFSSNGYLYGWKLGILSTKIGLEHTEFSSQVYPGTPEFMHQRFLKTAEFATRYQLGVYQRAWLKDAGVVKFDPAKVGGKCRGNVDRVVTDPVGLTAEGWSVTKQKRDVLIVLTDAHGETIGYGVTGQTRKDVHKDVAGAGAHNGWVGFAKHVDGPVAAYAYTGGMFCRLSGQPAVADH